MNFKSNLLPLFIFLNLSIILNACTGNSSGNKTITDKKADSGKEIIAVYEDCAVYAGSTKFVFKPEKGETIEVSVLNKGMEDEELYRIKMPDNLVDDSKDLEGLPGANPKMVGKKFKLIYNEKSEVIEIQSMNK
jgi:hypothetical protein